MSHKRSVCLPAPSACTHPIICRSTSSITNGHPLVEANWRACRARREAGRREANAIRLVCSDERI